MKKHKILYDWPIAKITYLTDSSEAENYANHLPTAPLASFTTLTERIRGLGADMASSRASRTHFTKWGELRQHLGAFDQEFGNFPNGDTKKFRLLLILSEKLAQVAPPLDTTNVKEDAFTIHTLSQVLPVSLLARENTASPVDSAAIFTCNDLVKFEADIAASNLSPVFIFHFLAALQALDQLPPSHAILLKKTTAPIDTNAVESFARILILMSGKPVHSARRYANTPKILNPDAICAGHAYHQWNDVFHVLSEYNSRDEILLKYLTIYHVIENFMFKLPIVELEQKKSGSMFSIRDFRRLYDRVDMKEMDALKDLFTAVFLIQASTSKTFGQHIISRWTALVSGTTQANIDKALDTLGVNFKFNDFKAQAAAGCFTRLVYVIRNAIVHNKETEFHLTYASLDANVCYLIESFLLPSLEEISYAVIGSPNTQLWYKNRELLLYK
jgi:hypothetical protein